MMAYFTMIQLRIKLDTTEQCHQTRRMRRLLVYVVLLAACTDVVAPASLPEDAEPYENPAFAQMWSEVEQCSGLRGDFSAVQFYVVPHFSSKEGVVKGQWYRPHRIVLAATWKNHEPTIKHEMMHDLLQDSGHPPHYFNGVCGNLL
jgi:hypothetical protein